MVRIADRNKGERENEKGGQPMIDPRRTSTEIENGNGMAGPVKRRRHKQDTENGRPGINGTPSTTTAASSNDLQTPPRRKIFRVSACGGSVPRVRDVKERFYLDCDRRISRGRGCWIGVQATIPPPVWRTWAPIQIRAHAITILVRGIQGIETRGSLRL